MSIHVLVLSNPAAKHLRILDRLPTDVTLTVGSDPEFIAEAAPRADVILNGTFNNQLLRIALPLAAKVQWIHTLSAGVDNVLYPELVASPVPLTNGRGVFRRPLAEWAIAAALFFAKDLRRLVHQQEAGVWDQFDIDELSGATLGIIGYGEIGRAVAQRAHAFGMRIVALRRRASTAAADPLLDAVYPPDRLDDLLRESDYVVVSAPNTPETRGMIGAAQFALMKPHSVIVNVGRGPVIVEADLVRALEENRIRGAALDVFDQEPLPDGHPFYRLRNVLLSPHSADHFTGWAEAAVEAFVRNFEHFVKGEPLENIVDKQAGY